MRELFPRISVREMIGQVNIKPPNQLRQAMIKQGSTARRQASRYEANSG